MDALLIKDSYSDVMDGDGLLKGSETESEENYKAKLNIFIAAWNGKISTPTKDESKPHKLKDSLREKNRQDIHRGLLLG